MNGVPGYGGFTRGGQGAFEASRVAQNPWVVVGMGRCWVRLCGAGGGGCAGVDGWGWMAGGGWVVVGEGAFQAIVSR